MEEIRSTVGWLTERLHEEQAALSLSLAPETNHKPIAAIVPLAIAPALPWWKKPGRYGLGAVAALLLLGGTIAFVSIRQVGREGPDQQVVATAAPAPPGGWNGPFSEVAAKKSPAPLAAKAVKGKSIEGVELDVKPGLIAMSRRGPQTTPLSVAMPPRGDVAAQARSFSRRSAGRPEAALAGGMVGGMAGNFGGGGMGGMGGMAAEWDSRVKVSEA